MKLWTSWLTIVLGQFGVGFFKLADLLGIEHMDLALEPAQGAIFPESVHEIMPLGLAVEGIASAALRNDSNTRGS